MDLYTNFKLFELLSVYIYIDVQTFFHNNLLQKDLESIEVNDAFSAHELAGGSLSCSPHRKWMASCGSDGRVTIRIPASAVSILMQKDY